MTTDDWEEPEPKYVVFKLDEWRGIVEPSTYPQPVNDAVVIRLKDPFAATALYTYCNTIMSMLELLPEEYLSEAENQRMLDIADYFHGKAMDSEKIKGKRLPD